MASEHHILHAFVNGELFHSPYIIHHERWAVLAKFHSEILMFQRLQLLASSSLLSSGTASTPAIPESPRPGHVVHRLQLGATCPETF
jgi:hypothetical protein